MFWLLQFIYFYSNKGQTDDNFDPLLNLSRSYVTGTARNTAIVR